MFAALLTEAGELNVPRAEAVHLREDIFRFEWNTVGHSMPEDTVVYAGLYITRRDGPCIGMAPLKAMQPHVNSTDNLSMEWPIHIPMGKPRDDDDGEHPKLGGPSGLVKRLRAVRGYDKISLLCQEAANEIEKLLARVK